MSNVRLPGAAAFVPPAAAPVAPASTLPTRSDRETYFQTQTFVARGAGSPGLPPQQSVWASGGTWRGCDVYIQPVPPPGGFSAPGVLSIFVYAVTEGMRCLVASGRYFVTGGVTQQFLPPRWIASARALATKFEVTSQWTQDGALPFVTGAYSVAIVASDQCVEPREDIGQELAGLCYLEPTNNTSIGGTIGTRQPPDNLELVNVRAVNLVAAPRYLMLFDTTLAFPPAGAVPNMCWPMGATIGGGIADTHVRYRAIRKLQLFTSTTGDVLALSADCAISAEVR